MPNEQGLPGLCPNEPPYMTALAARARRERIPLAGSLDLTQRCNLSCVHCYVGPAKPAESGGELGTSEWHGVIDQAAELGCLFLLLTGGEPLLREDFPTIYMHAREKGCIVSVFTNGTRVDDRIVGLFRDSPPKELEITIYGATAATHEAVTGVPGSHKRTLSAVDRLLAAGLRVNLKTVLMKQNLEELSEMQNLATKRDVPFRLDPAVFARLSGDRGPTTLRVPARAAARAELSDPIRRRHWRAYIERARVLPTSDKLYNCGAGLSSFHVDPYGKLQPCLMTPHMSYELRTGSFRDGWRDHIPRIREVPAPPAFECNHCERRAICGYCPGFFRLESGKETERVEYLCNLGRHRLTWLQEEAGAANERAKHETQTHTATSV